MVTADQASSLVSEELKKIADPRLASRIRELLVPPYFIDRDWDYGHPGEKFKCWTVLEHRPSNTGLAYCAQGFSPTDPWGVVPLSGKYMSIGMDVAWFTTLESAMRESKA
jgi:hypothetical protein